MLVGMEFEQKIADMTIDTPVLELDALINNIRMLAWRRRSNAEDQLNRQIMRLRKLFYPIEIIN